MGKRGKLSFKGCASGFADEDEWERILSALGKQKWVVYPKRVPAEPETALRYLARYTHKVAIGDSRIKDISNGEVAFSWRDRQHGNAEKERRIPVEEFTKRFLYHILPKGFHKIRYGGWMSAAWRKATLPAIRKALGADTPSNRDEEQPVEQRILEETGIDITLCPFCRKGHMKRTEQVIFYETAPCAMPP